MKINNFLPYLAKSDVKRETCVKMISILYLNRYDKK